MSKRTHDKELERARAKRRAAAEQQRRRRRLVVVAVVAVLAIGAFVAALVLTGDDAGVEVADDEQAVSQLGDETGTDADDAESPTDTKTGTDAGTGTDPAAAGDPDGTDDGPAAEPCPQPTDAPEPAGAQYDAPPEMTLEDGIDYTAVVETTCGTMTIDLAEDAAPVTVNNFVFLAREGYYDGVGFHRVVEDFMVQGGDPTGTGSGGPGYQFEDELELAQQTADEHGGYPRGTVAMANSGPDTNGSQFFVVQGVPVADGRDAYPLPPDYAVFGTVTDGLDVVDRIAAGEVEGQLAVEPVRILSIDIEETAA